MPARKIRRLMHSVRYTPLHPQWFAYRYERHRHKQIASIASGKVLDIGCGRQSVCEYLASNCDYVSLDHPDTGANLYDANPLVFGDAHKLPFADESLNTVLLIEVLEHLPEPDQAFSEALRVLSPNGQLLLSTPFLYPVHDAPQDFQRWTQYGLAHLLQNADITYSIKHMGTGCETSALLANIAWSNLLLTLISRKPLALILTPLLAIGVLINNLLASTLSHFETEKGLMTIGYFIRIRKPLKS